MISNTPAAIGSSVSLEINGKLAWKIDGLESDDGYIGLQAEVPGGGMFKFRNIKITKLASGS